MTLQLMVIFSKLVEKKYLCDQIPNPLPLNLIFFLHYETYDFVNNITDIIDIPSIVVFCIVFDVINKI